MRTILFECRNNLYYRIGWVVLKQDVYMVSICLHAFNVPVVFYACLVQGLLNIITELSIQYFLAILGHQNDVYHQKIFVMSPVLIIIH